MKVLVIHDHVPESASRDLADALVQARAVCQALDSLGHEWMTLGLTLDLDAARTAIQRLNPHRIFNLVESLGGIGRLIHLPCYLFDALQIPYTGGPADAILQTSNKTLAKRMMRSAKIPTPRWYSAADLAKPGCAIMAGDYIIKSVWEHASIGLDEHSVLYASDAATLLDAIQSRASSLGGEGFAEQYIDGREFNLALLAENEDHTPQILAPAEMVFLDHAHGSPRVLGYRAKWLEDSPEYERTVRRFEFDHQDAALLQQMKRIAIECWRCFELRGYARVDFRVDAQGQPWVLEVNANPCLSPDAGFAAALHASNVPYESAIERMLQDVGVFSSRVMR